MEEIYKPEDKEADKVELYNRENNDILGDMPNWLIHTGSHIIYGLIGLLIIFAAFVLLSGHREDRRYHRRLIKNSMDNGGTVGNHRPIFRGRPAAGEAQRYVGYSA